MLKANAVVAMIHPTTKAEKLRYLIDDSGASAVLTREALAEISRVTAGNLHAIATGAYLPETRLA